MDPINELKINSSHDFLEFKQQHCFRKIKKPSDFFINISIFFKKIWNFAFGDKKWYTEAKIEKRFRRLEDNPLPEAIGNYLSTPLEEYKSKVNARILYHILGGSVGPNTHLEGNASSLVLEYLIENPLFKENYSDDLQNKLLLTLNLAKDPSPEGILEQIKEAKDAHSILLLAFGWVGDPTGHAIYLKFDFREDVVKARLYNVGANEYSVEEPAKIPSYVDWINIPFENLMHLSTWQSFNELTTRSQDTHYGVMDIYHAFRNTLDPKVIQFPEKVDEFKSKQLIGHCSWKSLALVLHDESSSVEHYKSFMLKFSLETLLQFIESHSEPTLEDWKLVEKAWSKLQYDCHEYNEVYHCLPFLTGDFAQIRIQIKNWIKSHKHIKHDFERKKEQSFSKPILLDPPITSKTIPKTAQQPSQLLFDEKNPFNMIQMDVFIDSLDKLVLSYEDEKADAALRVLLAKIDLSNLSSLFPEKIEDLEKCSQFIEKLTQLAFKIFVEEDCLFEQHQSTLLAKLIYIQEAILKKVYGDEWQTASLGREMLNDRILSYHSPQESLEREILESKPEAKGCSFGFTTAYGLIPMLERTFSANPQFKDYFIENTMRILKTPPSELSKGYNSSQKDAAYYATVQLPKTLECYRNTVVYSFFLKYYSTSEKKIIYDRSKQPNLIFNIKDLRSCTELSVRVEGLSFQPRDSAILAYRTDQKTLRRKKFDNILLHPHHFERDLKAYRVKTPLDEKFTKGGWPLFKLIDFLYSQPNEIDDQDMQYLLQKYLFSLNELALANKTSIKQLFDWINHAYALALDQNKLQTCLFLSRTLVHLESHFPEQIPHKSLDCLRRLLKEASDPNQKSLIYYEILYAYTCQKELEGPQILELLKATAFLKAHPLDRQSLDRTIDKKVRAVTFQHKEKISEFFKQPSSELRQYLIEVLQEFIPIQATTEFYLIKESEADLQLSCEGQIYFPYSGEITGVNYGSALPEVLYSHFKNFDQIFPNRYDVKFDRGNYTFKDHKGQLVEIQIIGNDVQVRHWIKGEVFRLLPSQKLTPLHQIGYLEFGCSAWQSEKNPATIYLQSYADENLKFIINLRRKNRNDEQDEWELVSITQNGCEGNLYPSSYNIFESRDYILEIVNPNDRTQILQLNFVRFDLNFTQANGSLYCQQFSGFKLKAEPVKALGTFDNYLVIENELGQKKVLIPNHFFKRTTFEVLQASYGYERDALSLEKQTYHIFDLESEGQLISTKQESLLFLANIMQINQEYGACQNLLNQIGPGLGQFSPHEVKSLRQMFEVDYITGDQSPLAIANSMKAGIYLHKNALLHTKEPAEVPPNLIHKYHLYLNKLKKIGSPFRLSQEEEEYLLSQIANIHHYPYLNARYEILIQEKQINGIQEKISPQNHSQTITMDILNSIELTPVVDQEYEQFKEDFLNLKTMTRLELSRNFPYYYAMALDQTLDRKGLETSLNFSMNSQKNPQKNLPLAVFLLDVIKHPDQYQALPKTSRELEVWKNQMSRLDFSHSTANPPMPISYKNQNLTPSFPLKVSVAYAFNSDYKNTINDLVKLKFKKNAADAYEDYFDWLKKVQETTYDSALKKEWKRLLEDSENFIASTVATIDPLSNYSQIAEMQASIQDEIQILDRRISNQKENLIALANKPFNSQDRELIRLLWKDSQKIKKITIEQLIISFGQGNLGKILELNPALKLEDLELLSREIGRFLLDSTESQRLNRLLVLLNQANAENFDQLAEKGFWDEMAINFIGRAFDPCTYPALLVFEYYGEIRLRDKQIEKLKIFLESGETSVISELIMGSGKSKVILPLLALLRAKAEELSVVVLPENLYESIGKDTQNTLWSTLGSKLRSVRFDYQTKCERNYLKALLSEIKNAKAKNEPIICTDKTLHCLLLKYLEMAYSGFSEELPLLREILSFLKVNGRPLLEEADFILNVTKETMFQFGESQKLNKDETHLVCLLYKIIYDDPEIKQAFRLESDKNAYQQSPPFSPSQFRKIAPMIVKKLFNQVKDSTESDPENKEIHEFIYRILNHFDKDYRKTIDYVLRSEDEDTLADAQEFFDKQKDSVKDFLALLGQELSVFLPINLGRNHNEKYGLGEVQTIAIPYKSANHPAHSSQFSNIHITINYTLQTYLKLGIPKDVIENRLKTLQNKALIELNKKNKDASLQDTFAWKEFKALTENTSFPLFNYTQEQLNQLINTINQSPKKIIDFVEQNILWNLETNDERLSSNPLLLVSLFERVYGFTGTLWNGMSMHSKLKQDRAGGIEGKTLAILWKNSAEAIFEIPQGSPEEMLESLPPFDLLTDAGAYFKDQDDETIASMISKKTGQAVSHYSKEGLLIVPSPNSQKTYLSQNFAVGADTKQKEDAIGLVTIGKEMLLRDLLQSVWRLRGLDKKQQVKFVLTAEMSRLIKESLHIKNDQPLKLEHIIAYAVSNQVKRQEQDGIKALMLELDSVIQMEVLDLSLKPDFVEKYPKLMRKLIDKYWVKGIDNAPQDRYGDLPLQETRKDFLKSLKKRMNKKIKSFTKQIPPEFAVSQEGMLEKITHKIEHFKKHLPKEITKIASEENDSMETSTVTLQETQTETLTDVLTSVNQSIGILDCVKGEGLKSIPHFDPQQIYPVDGKIPCFPLSSYFYNQSEFKYIYKEFEGISASVNMFLWNRYDPSNDRRFRFFGSNRIEPHFILIKDEEMIFLSDIEVQQYKRDKDLYHLGVGFCNQDKNLTDPQKFCLLKMKFLRGEVRYSEEEKLYLEYWFDGNAAVFEDFFKNNILAHSKEIQEKFSGSALEEVFQKLVSPA